MIILGLLLQVVASPTTSLSSQGQQPRINEFEQHYPRLYFNADDLHKLRAQTQSSHAKIYQELTKLVETIRTGQEWTPPKDESLFRARWNEVYGNNLAVLSIYCALTPQDKEAIDHAKLYMDRFTSYKTWLVKGKEQDEVPLAHSLLGYVTCFDSLHNLFTPTDRKRYASKIRSIGSQLYNCSKERWWGRSYIHNHVATNYMALLTAALALKPYYPNETLAWETKATKALDRTMRLLNLVVDGSFQEGVSYGTYTMRSLIQFMFLSEKHLATSYRDNFWVHEHFNFLFHTIIPGFQYTVGFADTIKKWAYDPESELTFLDNYILKDGRATWLAREIKRSRTNSAKSSRIHIHMEFLFYNSTLKLKPLSGAKLHVFSDWGVVIYGGGTPESGVFLAFKSGHLHGRAINLLRPNLSNELKRSFAPGHEHPDQGSFVFMTKDQAIVTEPRYGPKFPFLQNTLMFGPAHDDCTPPYRGQLGGGCNMWFKFKDLRTWFSRADLVGHSRENDVIFMSGDFTATYDVRLQLNSVYRALIMLHPEVLVVVDIVRFREKSVSTLASAFFHNSDFVFKLDLNTRPRCAGIGRYKMCWNHLNSETVNVSTKNNFIVPHRKYVTNFINVTWQRHALLSSTAYVFHGPKYSLRDLKIFKVKENGINITFKLNALKYDIVLSTRHDDPRLRRKLLGTNGCGKVYVKSSNSSSVFNLGVRMTTQFSKVTLRNDVIKEQGLPHALLFSAIHLPVYAVLLFICFILRRRLNRLVRLVVFCLILIWSATFFAYIFSSYKHFTLRSTRLPQYSTNITLPTQKTDLNAVFITGLPSNGVELAREMFTTNRDFITIDIPSEAVGSKNVSNLDLCEWLLLDEKTKNWLETVLKTPKVHANTNMKDYISLANPFDLSSKSGALIRKSQGAFAVVNFESPSWLFRMKVLFQKRSTPLLYVVRDPRSWIEHILREPNQKASILAQFKTAIKKRNCTFPREIQLLREIELDSSKAHITLAYIWTAFVSYARRLKSTLIPEKVKILQFENMITSPKATADDVYSFLEMPFTAAVEHRILQVTKTRLYRFKKYGIIGPKLCSWGKFLTKTQISDIERICADAMNYVGYKL